MTNFLPAGIINETLDEICQQIKTLKELMDAGEHDKVRQGQTGPGRSGKDRSGAMGFY